MIPCKGLARGKGNILHQFSQSDLESDNDIFLESTIMSGCLNRIQPNVGKVSQLCFLVIYFRKYSKAFSCDQNFRMKI